MENVRPHSKQITVILESHNAEQFNTRKSFSFNLECKVDQKFYGKILWKIIWNL